MEVTQYLKTENINTVERFFPKHQIKNSINSQSYFITFGYFDKDMMKANSFGVNYSVNTIVNSDPKIQKQLMWKVDSSTYDPHFKLRNVDLKYITVRPNIEHYSGSPVYQIIEDKNKKKMIELVGVYAAFNTKYDHSYFAKIEQLTNELDRQK